MPELLEYATDFDFVVQLCTQASCPKGYLDLKISLIANTYWRIVLIEPVLDVSNSFHSQLQGVDAFVW